jgi:hypothetical protein
MARSNWPVNSKEELRLQEGGAKLGFIQGLNRTCMVVERIFVVALMSVGSSLTNYSPPRAKGLFQQLRYQCK